MRARSILPSELLSYQPAPSYFKKIDPTGYGEIAGRGTRPVTIYRAVTIPIDIGKYEQTFDMLKSFD